MRGRDGWGTFWRWLFASDGRAFTAVDQRPCSHLVIDYSSKVSACPVHFALNFRQLYPLCPMSTSSHGSLN
ncbi:UvrABC system protein [Trichinella spiralis]|uniref:UvrABC system protein n=1 Tax=Trichinella spiralis TaxID=6334 RepID=A0ABR3K935_TRISP